MIPAKLLEVLSKEGVVAIVTEGKEGAHLVNSWNSYIKITTDESLLVPVGGMKVTEANLQENNKVLVTIGSREVEGFHSKGTGFLITGTASMLYEGARFNKTKESFPWARAVLEIRPEAITQTL
ncbi:pyridoxamine 5'-phosphate oxidase family protein [Clostridium tunisiense]|nr:pyridoxamine 5'-phosphate oxidase family protein [Clostridium tunisiense]